MGPLFYNLLTILELYLNVIYCFITGQYPM